MTQAVNISESGRRAFDAGIKISDNPFKIGSEARSLWSKGYKARRDEKAREDRKAKDVLSCALRSSDLDESVKTILGALRLPNVGVGLEFSPKDRETYAALLNCYRRAEFLKSWLVDELDQAADRVGTFG